MKRRPMNKYRSARGFKKMVRKTKAANLRANPMRGGWRL